MVFLLNFTKLGQEKAPFPRLLLFVFLYQVIPFQTPFAMGKNI